MATRSKFVLRFAKDRFLSQVQIMEELFLMEKIDAQKYSDQESRFNGAEHVLNR